EAGVGLIPGGAGTLNLLWRALQGIPEGAHVDTYPIVTQVFQNIALAKVSTSAHEAKALGYLPPSDRVSLHPARLLHHAQAHAAKARALGLAAAAPAPPAPRAYTLPGENGIATLQMLVQTLQSAGQASAHDGVVAMKLAHVLCGGVDGHVAPVSEEKLLELE